MFTQTPQQVPPSNAVPVDIRNFKCIFLLNITYFSALFLWIILQSLDTLLQMWSTPTTRASLVSSSIWPSCLSCSHWQVFHQFLLSFVYRRHHSKHVDAAGSGEAPPADTFVERLPGQPAETQVWTIKNQQEITPLGRLAQAPVLVLLNMDPACLRWSSSCARAADSFTWGWSPW